MTAIDALDGLGAPSDPHLDALCRVAHGLFGVSTVLMTIVGRDEVRVSACEGRRPDRLAWVSAYCDRALRGAPGTALVVPDTDRDAGRPADPGPPGAARPRFYAGVPLALRPGLHVGTLCLLDVEPRHDFDERRVAQLVDLARAAEAVLHLRAARTALADEVGKRQHLDRLLSEREARVRSALEFQRIAEEVAGVGRWRLDGVSRRMHWSEGVARIFGRPLTGDGTVDLETHLGCYTPEDGDKVRRAMELALSSDRTRPATFHHRSTLVRPGGERRHVLVQGAVEYDADGRPRALHGAVLDVTDVTASERQRRDSDDLLRTTLEQMDQGLVLLGPDQRVRLFNARARDLLQLPDTVLHAGAAFREIRDFQRRRGDFVRMPAAIRDEVIGSDVRQFPRIYEWARPDGRTLEVRRVPLPDGSSVTTFTDVTQQRADEVAIQASERRYRLLAENTTDIVIWCTLDTTRLYVSPAARAVFGYDAEALVGTRAFDFVHPEDAPGFREVLARLQAGDLSRAVRQQRYRCRDGSYVWIESTFCLTFDERTGTATGYVAALRDITDRRAAEAALRESQERLALALENGSDGVWDWRAQTDELWFSDRVLGMLGYSPGEIEVSLRSWAALIHPADKAVVQACFYDHLAGRSPIYECEHRLRRRDGRYAWILARGRVVSRSEDGRAARVVGTHIDITERKEATLRAVHLARHDVLTALPNRILFHERLEQALGEVGRGSGSCAVLYGDLDRFKTINDTLGHIAGDALLAEVAARIASELGGGDMAARFGGDEFVILHRTDTDPAPGPESLARRIIEAVNRPVLLDGRPVQVGISLGICSAPRDGADGDVLLCRADLALRRAKEDGRGSFRLYEPAMDETAREKQSLEMDLRGALARGEFEVHYQPIVEVRTGHVSGAEALLRWRHPVRGLVSPAVFIPLAEETGLIKAIGEWVLRTACREAAAWPDTVRVAVNISPVQLREAGLIGTVLGALAASTLPPGRLELEITETALMQDGPEVARTLRELRGLGLSTALDDFGTGYSSLGYLQRFAFDKLKIDRSFIQGIADPAMRRIVRAIVSLGQDLGMSVTAEGVETQEQFEIIRNKGCTSVQGYLFSRPVDAPAFRRYLDDRAAGALAA